MFTFSSETTTKCGGVKSTYCFLNTKVEIYPSYSESWRGGSLSHLALGARQGKPWTELTKVEI